jgi:hypothetical protein
VAKSIGDWLGSLNAHSARRSSLGLTANAKVVHRARFNFFSEARIWYNRGKDRLPGDPHETFADCRLSRNSHGHVFQESIGRCSRLDIGAVIDKFPNRDPLDEFRPSAEMVACGFIAQSIDGVREPCQQI